MGYRRQSFAEAVLIALLEGVASVALEVGVDKQKSFRADVASRFGRNVEFMSAYNIAREFFDGYTRALLDRDAKAISDFYAVPALIEFPEQAIAVSDANQTEEFFAGAFDQYEGVTTTEAIVEVVAATSHSIWADVTWDHHSGAPNERNMYQLIRTGDDWKISVLTPLDE